jgi:dolichyldiphosphatase
MSKIVFSPYSVGGANLLVARQKILRAIECNSGRLKSLHRLQKFTSRRLNSSRVAAAEEPFDMPRGQSSAEGATSSGSPSRVMHALGYINESTKWVVSGMAFAILLGRRDEITAWCIIGGVISAIICRFLKFAINASRPAAARKKDPGMPSSHACTLGFLSMYPFLMVLESSKSSTNALSMVTLALALPLGGLFLTSLRVLLGYHTIPQVIVGWCLGSSIAFTWLHFGLQIALPFLMSHVVGRYLLLGLTCAFVALFAIKNVMRWRKESY